MLLKFAWEDLWAICLSIDVINVGRMPRRKLPQTVPRLAHHQTTTNCEFSRMFSCWLLMYKRDWHKSSYQRESQPPANPIILLKGHHQLNVKFIHHLIFHSTSPPVNIIVLAVFSSLSVKSEFVEHFFYASKLSSSSWCSFFMFICDNTEHWNYMKLSAVARRGYSEEAFSKGQ